MKEVHYYCENCGCEMKRGKIELPDGTILCSKHCKDAWESAIPAKEGLQ